MGLFGNRGEKAEQEETAQAEAQRLAALSPAELAVQLLPGIGGSLVSITSAGELALSEGTVATLLAGA